MIPSIGRVVHIRLSAQCATEINRRRKDTQEKAADVRAGRALMQHGEQVHTGNSVQEGDEFPLLICRVWDNGQPAKETTGVNGQVFLDGNDVLWATSVVGSGSVSIE
jgi:hypothetical protein